MSDRLFAVCCAVQIPAEVMNEFIQENQDKDDSTDTFLAFVDDLDKVYTGQAEIGFTEPTSSNPPFAGKTPQECRDMLVQVKSNGTNLDVDYFAIFDERSLRDNSVLLVHGDIRETEEIETVRAAIEETSSRLLLYVVSYADIAEDQEKAKQAADGIFRED